MLDEEKPMTQDLAHELRNHYGKQIGQVTRAGVAQQNETNERLKSVKTELMQA